MKWHKINLTNREVAAGKQLRIQDDFQNLCVSLNLPDELAMYSIAYDQQSEVTLYFTPLTQKMAPEFLDAIDAKECERPNEPMVLLFGKV